VSTEKSGLIELPALLQAEPISYMPATIAAIAVLAVVGLLFVRVLAVRLQRYRRNRYRRVARAGVRQLAGQVEAGQVSRKAAAAALNQLLKRTALAASTERQQVAMLTGAAWWRWLDGTLPSAAESSFSAVGAQWQRQLWQPDSAEPSSAEWCRWLALAERWIVRHALTAEDKPQ